MKKILTLALLFAPTMAGAQVVDPFGVNELSTVNLGSKPLAETIAGVVNIILGFLGILTTLIILWGGFKWMTSFGSSDKVDEAKKLIGAGVIGLLIVLVSYAISQFVLRSLVNETVNP